MPGKSTETEIAVLQTQMTAVTASLEAIKVDQHANFQALASKIDNLSGTPLEISGIIDRLSKLEKARAKTWLWQTLSAAAGAIITLLVTYVLTHP